MKKLLDLWKCYWKGHEIVRDEDGFYCEDCLYEKM